MSKNLTNDNDQNLNKACDNNMVSLSNEIFLDIQKLIDQSSEPQNKDDDISKLISSNKVNSLIKRIYDRENRIKRKIDKLRMEKMYDEVKHLQAKPVISKRSQDIIRRKKKAWKPIYQPERIDQIQKSRQRSLNILKEKFKQEKLEKEMQEEQEIQKCKVVPDDKRLDIKQFEEKYYRQVAHYHQKKSRQPDMGSNRTWKIDKLPVN